MSIFSKIKKWLTGDDSSSKNKSSNNNSRSSRASRVSNYGGGGSRSYRENYSTGSSRYQSREDEERRRRQEQKDKRQATTNALASISKRTDALASGKSSSPASSATSVGNGTTRVLAKIGEKSKATPPDPKEQARQRVQKDATKRLKQISDDRKEMNEATGNKYNVEQKDKKKASEARRRIRSGEMSSDPTVARVGFEQHPIANLAGRKIAQGASFGLADLAENKLAGDKFKESRRLYKKAEKEHPWISGLSELAGGMVGFGLTGGATDALGARAVSKLAPNAVDDLARSRLGQRLAKSAVDKAVKKGIVSESTEELVKQVGKDRARKIVNALGNEAVQNLTTGAVYDIANASNEHELFSDDWWKELGKSAAFNSIATTGVAGIAGLGGGRNLVRGARNFLDEQGRMRNIMMDTFSGNAERAGRNAQALAERGVKETTDALSPMNLSSKADKMSEMRKAMQDTFAQNADEARRVDMNEILAQNSPFRQADEAVTPQATEQTVQNAAENATEEVLGKGKNTYRYAVVYGNGEQKVLTIKADKASDAADIALYSDRDIRMVQNVTPKGEKAKAVAQNSPVRQVDEAVKPQPVAEAVRPQNIDNAALPPLRPAGEAYQYPDAQTFIRELDERGEQWLGQYGHITANEDGTYNLFRNGVGDSTLSREEAVDYISRARESLQGEELARAERERVTRTTPLNEAENARIAEIDDEVERLRAESNADAEALRNNRYNGIDEYDARQAERAKTERSLSNERDNIVRKEPPKAEPEAPKRKPTKNEQRRDALQAERDEIAERYNAIKGDASVPQVEKQAMLDDMQELDLELRDLDARIKRADAKRSAKANKATPPQTRATEQAPNINEENAPRTDLVPRKEASRAKTENTRTGERTEFRRNNEETAKEQARAKRTTNNRQSATQETFDKDFEAFERRVSENQSKADDLRQKIRSASSDEEKAALKKQLDELNSEIRREFNKASMRYHPDRGGSNEWMRQFNDVYDSYKRGSYKSRRFSGAESSQRAGTGARAKARERYRAQSAGGNGNTPPPPRGGASEAGERGFKKPKGKAAAPKEQRTVYNVEDLVNKKRQRTSDREKIEEAYHVAKRKIVNSMASFEDANLKNVKSNPEKWSANNAAVDKTRRHGAIAGRSIREGQLQANGKRFSGTVERVGADGKTYKIENGKSLMQIYDGMDEKTESAFDAYLLLKHAPDRIREGTPIFDRIKLASNESLNDVKVVNREADRLLKEHPEFAERAEEIYQFTQNELENRVKAGLLSQETASKWMKDHPFYVPTGRDGYFNAVHGNHKGVIGADPIKAAKGSDLDIRSIKEQLAEATNRNWRDITTNNLLEKYFGDAVKTDMPVDDGLDLLNNTVGLSKSADGRKFYAKIFRNGDMYRVEIDKHYYDDLDDLYKNGSIGPISDTVASASSKFSGLFKKLVTSWNPFFMPKNFSRDIQDAIINTRQTKEFFESLGPAAKELSNDGEFLRAFRDSGVSQANLVNLDESLTNGKGGVFGKALDKFATLNEAVETWPRLAEFMATIKKAGYTKLDDIPPEKYTDLIDTAAANAADVTVNFARSGSVGKNLNKGLVPFFNPSVQGWSKFIRNFREQRGLKQMLGTIAKASMLGAGTAWINNTWLEDNPNYQQLSARDKATNYIIPWVWGNDRTADNTDTFVKIPRGRFAAVYSLATVNAKNENDMGWAEMVKVGKDQIAPVDPLESSIYAPFLLAKKNETWYGSPIVPESIKNDTHPSEEYDQNTSYLGRALGKATENLPKELQISPKKADYIIDAETGVAGDFLLPALTPSRQGGGKGFIGKVGPAVLNVAKRQFTIDSTTQNDLSSRFYDKMQTAEDNKKSSKATDKDSAEYKRMNAYQKEVSTLTTAIRDLQAGDRATKQEDIRGLQEVRNKMMQDALDGKKPPSSAKAMDAVQKYVGTSYAIDKFGSSSDKDAMKLYGKAVYGNISEKEMAKKIDADKDFYKGVRAVGKLEDKIARATGKKNTTTLAKSVALAEAGASDELFGAYGGTKQSRVETDNKMNRARNYVSNGGSTSEFVKLEKIRKDLGKLSDYDQQAEIEKAEKDLGSGKITLAEYKTKEQEIEYNANRSYVGLATSLSQANAPARGYVLYDIKAKNVQKGINLAAMGFTARDYRQMMKELDADGNGYPKKQEIVDYVNSRDDIEDKATLYDALYYYNGKYNPFGAVTKYSREQAAAAGKANGVEQISDEKGALKLKDDEESSSKSGYRRRYGRRRWRRWGGYGGGGSSKAKVPTPKTIKASSLKAGKALVSKSSSSSAKAVAPKLERVKAKIDLPEAKW